jgi:hypothetical protein
MHRIVHLESEGRNHELQDQIDSRDTYGFGDVCAYVRDSKGWSDARRAAGSISVDRGSLVDLRLALRKTEISEIKIQASSGAEHARARAQVHDLPISTPVMNTSTPPKPTCRAAETQGVSM